MKNKSIKFIIAIAIFLPNLVLAANTPRIYIAGYAGTDSNLLGKADILAPVYLTANNNLFVYAQGKYGHENSTYTGSLGVGFRQIVKDTAVLGAYVFGDYTNSTSGHDFWVISPGIESLSRAWDFRANGYFPVSKKKWLNGFWASDLGDYRYTTFTEYKQYDHWYQYYQETGIGEDAEIGRNLFKIKKTLFKGYINGYHYNIKHDDDVIGGGARLTMQPDQVLKISLRYSYDNYEHSTFMAGVQLALYNSVDIQNLQRNLFIPIERNLGTIGSGSSIPVIKSDNPEDVGPRVKHDNVWFFKSGVAGSNVIQGDGTYENPFTAFTTAEVNYIKTKHATIDPYPLLYFNSGSYPLTDFSNNRFAVPAGWNMYGWVMYNTPINHPAMTTQRPVLIGGINLLQGNNRLDSIAIHKNSGFQSDGLYITANNIYLNNIEVGALNNSIGYKTGIAIDHAKNVTLNDSQIYGFSAPTAGNAQAYGIDTETDSELKIGSNNTISAIATASGYEAGATGIYVIDYGTSFTLNGNENNISATASGHDAYAQGIQNWFGSKTTLSGNGNNVSATANGSRYANAQGIDAEDPGTSFTLSGSNNNISATATTNENHYAYAEGIQSWDGAETTLSGSNNNISATASGNYANATGIDVGYNGTSFTLSGSGNNIYATAAAANVVGKAYGMYIGHGSTTPILNILDSATNTTITVNGRNSAWGIYASQHAILQKNNSPISSAYAYDDLITYTNLNPKSHGNALEWDTMIRPW